MAIINGIKFTLMTLLIIFVSVSFAEIRSTEIRFDVRPIIPFDEFGFTHTGRLELNVSQISVSATIPDQEFAKLGFFLCTRDVWLQVLRQIDNKDISCALDSEFVSTVFTFNNINAADKSVQTVYDMSNPDQYALVFANCIKGLRISMNVESAMYDLEVKNGGRDYLSADKTVLPTVYFSFSLIYFALGCLWVHTLYKKRVTVSWVSWIHFFMLAVVIIDTLTSLGEAENMRYIKKTGTAHRWAVLLYIFSYLKGIKLFPLLALFLFFLLYLSMSEDYLQDLDKNLFMLASFGIMAQVLLNIRRVMADKTIPFAQDFVGLGDVACCCVVLIPIVWSTIKLLEAARTDGTYYLDVMLLTNFRYIYIVLSGYVYFTRVVVCVLETNTSYNYRWTSVVAAEFATLVLYASFMRLLVRGNRRR